MPEDMLADYDWQDQFDKTITVPTKIAEQNVLADEQGAEQAEQEQTGTIPAEYMANDDYAPTAEEDTNTIPAPAIYGLEDTTIN